MEEKGLAQQSASMPSIKDVAMMLMQGMSPEELVQRGMPQELVQAAVQMLRQQMQLQENKAGLANTVVQGVSDVRG